MFHRKTDATGSVGSLLPQVSEKIKAGIMIGFDLPVLNVPGSFGAGCSGCLSWVDLSTCPVCRSWNRMPGRMDGRGSA